MNIIFLDVDGVLNSLAYFEQLGIGGKQSGFNDINDYNLQMLSNLYHKVNAKIVLSSTWRYLDDPKEVDTYPMYKYLIMELSRYNMEIIDKTPVIGGNRSLEIKTWSVKHNCKTFISLDDDFHINDYNNYNIGFNLVNTKYFTHNIEDGGLQLRHVNEAIRKFKLMSI